MGVTTMKTISLRIFGGLLVLGVLGSIVPAVRADDDYVAEINRYVDQIYQDQKDRDDYLNDIAAHAQQALADSQAATWPYGESDGPHGYEEPAASAAAQTTAPAAVATPQPKAPAPGPVAAPQTVAQPIAIPQDPAAFRQMVLQNQERVRQQIMETRQQFLQRSQEIREQSQMQSMGLRQ
jgi:hypothetical protein